MPEFNISDKFDSIIQSLDFKVDSKEVAYFSDKAGDVSLDKSELRSYQIKITNPNNYLNPFGFNTNIGSKNYIPKVYKSNESTIGNFLDCLVQIYDKTNKNDDDDNNNKNNKDFNIDLKDYNLICPSSFFQYISMKRESEFYIIYLNKRYVIANSETRAGQNVKMSYAGIRFEDLLIHGTRSKTLNNYNLFESVIDLKINGLKCLYVAEIDSYKKSNDTENKEEYTEIKMILCKNSIPHFKSKNKSDILSRIKKGNLYFDSFLFRLLIQCKFSNISNVVIGIRDQSFTIRNINEFSVEEDLLPFFHQHCGGSYRDRYLMSIPLIKRILDVIKNKVNDNNPVYKLQIGGSYQLKSIDSKFEKEKIIDTVLTPEFKEIILSL